MWAAAKPCVQGASDGALCFPASLSKFANLMVRVIEHKNYGVYVNDERGAPHHRAHAHILHRGMRVASVFLETLEYYMVLEDLPASLVDAISSEQEQLLDRWQELNAS
jgi:hypothetical protein